MLHCNYIKRRRPDISSEVHEKPIDAEDTLTLELTRSKMVSLQCKTVAGATLKNSPARQGETLMDLNSLIVWLIVGGVAGWLAGLIVKGYGLGLIGNIVVGIIGAFIAGWLLPRLGIVIGGGIIAAIINALIGAIILLVIIGLVRR
jgi:uncharacterized membrane protein YeaQ/YmgE (transglycosylase-associated protein family)